jgi:hypothetical protein
MKKLLFNLMLAMALLPSLAAAQALHYYQSNPGKSVNVAWDHSKFTISCSGTLVEISPATTSFVCDGRTYTVVWTGGAVRITGKNADGTDYLYNGSIKYKYRAVVTGGSSQISIVANGPGSYPFLIPNAGQYHVWGYVRRDSTTGRNSFFYSMDGSAQRIWATPSGTPDGEWLWDRINDGTSLGEQGPIVVFQLASGQHTLVLLEREAGTGLNGMVVAPTSVASPSAETELLFGEATGNTLPINLNTLGDIRIEVAAVLTDSGGEKMSAYAKSTDPAYATVDGVAKGWMVSSSLSNPSGVVMAAE